MRFQEALQTIYNNILSQNLANGFPQAVAKYSLNLVNAALAMHTRITSSFLPTAIKFHYIFNLRDLSNIFQVSANKQNGSFKSKIFLFNFRLWRMCRAFCLPNQRRSRPCRT